MKSLASLLQKYRSARSGGFTMIELLIVITILGILAVAVLSAINPVEQINRGRDTGSRSDAEQLLSAIDRYNAFKGFFPWQYGAGDKNTIISDDGTANGDLVQLTGSEPLDHGDLATPPLTPCSILNKISTYNATGASPCLQDQGTDELKATFITRIIASTSNPLFMFNNGQQGASTYVCFVPKSKAFRTEAIERCADENGAGLPADIKSAAAAATICAGYNDNSKDVYTCLP